MSLKVLLIDSSPAIQKAFKLSLNTYSCNLKPLSDHKEALKLIPIFKPNVIFIDYMNQDLQILEFVKICHKITKTSIILLQNKLIELNLTKELVKTIDILIKSKHIAGILEKPFDKQALRNSIHPYLYDTEADEGLDISVRATELPLKNWQNSLNLDSNNVKLAKELKKKNINITTAQLQKIIIEQLNVFFKKQSAELVQQLAIPAIQKCVEGQVKILAKNIIEKEIQKILSSPGSPLRF